MKYILACLVLISMVLVACAPAQQPIDLPPEPPAPGTIPSDAQLSDCHVDTDCVPIPACHPQRCINKDYADSFTKPQVCTQLFDETAAYSDDDCVCEAGLCVNKNAK